MLNFPLTRRIIRVMDGLKLMLRKILNGQSAMKSELLAKIEKVDKKVNNLGIDFKKIEKNLIQRIDKIGLQITKLKGCSNK